MQHYTVTQPHGSIRTAIPMAPSKGIGRIETQRIEDQKRYEIENFRPIPAILGKNERIIARRQRAEANRQLDLENRDQSANILQNKQSIAPASTMPAKRKLSQTELTNSLHDSNKIEDQNKKKERRTLMKTVITQKIRTKTPAPSISDNRVTSKLSKKSANELILATKAPLDSDQFAKSRNRKSKQSGVKSIEDGVSKADTSESTKIVRSKFLVRSIDKVKAKKFWDVGRPYFFAVKKSKFLQHLPIDLETLCRDSPDFSSNPIHLDNDYDIYIAKSKNARTCRKLPGIKYLQKFGIFFNPLRNFWNLDDEDFDNDSNIWAGASRATLSVLFRFDNPIFDRDVAYADRMVERLTYPQYNCGLKTALYLTTCSEEPTADLLRLLIQAGANPNADAGMYDVKTALANAISRKSFPAVEALLIGGADPDYAPDGGTMSGREAAEEYHSTEAKRLFDAYGF